MARDYLYRGQLYDSKAALKEAIQDDLFAWAKAAHADYDCRQGDEEVIEEVFRKQIDRIAKLFGFTHWTYSC